MPENLKLLAFDTSTDRLSIALTDGVRVWQHSGPGGAQASTTLIPAIPVSYTHLTLPTNREV